jgi:hypothetical protein
MSTGPLFFVATVFFLPQAPTTTLTARASKSTSASNRKGIILADGSSISYAVLPSPDGLA